MGDKRKPWEETWEATDMFYGSADVEHRGTAVMRTCGPDDEPYHYPRARLAAAAPDLVRALLAVEWAYDDLVLEHMCAWCGARKTVGHTHDCVRQAALRKAGVIE